MRRCRAQSGLREDTDSRRAASAASAAGRSWSRHAAARRPPPAARRPSRICGGFVFVGLPAGALGQRKLSSEGPATAGGEGGISIKGLIASWRYREKHCETPGFSGRSPWAHVCSSRSPQHHHRPSSFAVRRGRCLSPGAEASRGVGVRKKKQNPSSPSPWSEVL